MMAAAEKLQDNCASLPYCVQQTMSAIRDVIHGVSRFTRVESDESCFLMDWRVHPLNVY